MPRKPVSETIPSLEFSPSERRDVIEMVAGVMADALKIERRYLSHHGEPSKSEWKEVRGTGGGLRFFKERRHSESQGRPSISTSDSETEKVYLEELEWTTATSISDSISSDSFSGSFASDSTPMRFVDQIRSDIESSNTSSSNSSEPAGCTLDSAVYSRIPMIVGVGHVEGTLEDVALGLYAGDEASWKERGAYIKDGHNYSRILSTILGPTPDDPFRFLGVKWFAREASNPLFGTLIQDRDFLVVEGTGLTRDEHGEPHGYYVMHSFGHPLVPEFAERKILRCELSLCFISRQVGPNKVHMFTRGFIDPKGFLTPSMAITVSAKRISTCMKTIETAYLRKLVWLMKQRRRSRMQVASQHDGDTSVRVCEVCTKTFRFLSGNLSLCQVCFKCVCSKCTVKRKVVVGATATCATKHLLPFCSACVQEAKVLPPHQVALDKNIRHTTL
ncbi:hypothetical protein Poli38472_012550 [Pythium oligandrum]|uniref:FYVE-type domain-containing protein n=1 Tax=Pythium oligandrum TaxID=41045 RepID=A0A8K1CDE2_PYTOL|nr:hypothetical protein Poli38472_012550 [Pythium oligandrum]|eukprot:TMW61359.1 hypothetical protein Poli38472_012550 [Pythium oligandrum]